MLQDVVMVDKKQLLDEIKRAKKEGYRLAAATCEKEGEAFEIVYHLDLNYQMRNVKVPVNAGDKIKSISNIYPAAFLAENEFQDLYGFVFEGLSIDYKGSLYLAADAPKTPYIDKK